MLAIILAGGKGTRLKPFTMSIPKPLLPVGDVPIIEVVIRQLIASGVTRIVLTLGHMSHLFVASLGDGSRWGVPIEYCFEDEPLGTAGALRPVRDPGEDFLVMNGDILTTLDYRKLITAHRAQGAAGTIAVIQRKVDIGFGVIESDADNTLVQYREKPVITYDVSMGINVVSRHAIDLVPVGRRFDMPDLMLALRNAGEKVVCYKTDCYWQDIGLFDDYQRASHDFVTDSSRFLPAMAAACKPR